MTTLRSLLFYLFLALFTLLLVPIYPLVRRLWPHHARQYLACWAPTALWLLRTLCGVRYRVVGAEHIPTTPCVVLCRHESAWETIALQQILPAQTWVLKQELLRIPLFGAGLTGMDAIAIDRNAGKRALKEVIEQGKDRLQRGLWVIIFPEGTRMPPGEMGTFAVGGAMLAHKAGVPALPVAHNAGSFWPKNGLAKRAGTITVVIGPAIDGSCHKTEEINDYARSFIASQMTLLAEKQ
jgi:1-acyl-sn-glycerol-3-phosphate acyltransferase